MMRYLTALMGAHLGAGFAVVAIVALAAMEAIGRVVA